MTERLGPRKCEVCGRGFPAGRTRTGAWKACCSPKCARLFAQDNKASREARLHQSREAASIARSSPHWAFTAPYTGRVPDELA